VILDKAVKSQGGENSIIASIEIYSLIRKTKTT